MNPLLPSTRLSEDSELCHAADGFGGRMPAELEIVDSGTDWTAGSCTKHDSDAAVDFSHSLTVELCCGRVNERELAAAAVPKVP